MNKSIDKLMPTVSVLIPCYNAAPRLSACLESAIAQSPTEIILIDDGSTDQSLEIARQYSPQVTVFSQNNQGVQRTRNELFQQSSGDFIQYLDADDVLYPDKINRQLEAIVDSQNKVAYCDFDIDRGVFYPAYYKNQIDEFKLTLPLLEGLLRWEQIPQTNVFLFPRHVLEDTFWNEEYEAVHEHKLIFDLIKKGVEFVHTPFIGCKYYQAWRPEKQINLNMPDRLAAREKLFHEMFNWVETNFENIKIELSAPLESIKKLTFARLEHSKRIYGVID